MEKNYSKIYREKLFLFVKDTKVNCKKTLYSLVLAKSEELDNELNNEPNNKTKLILFYLLKLSLYFIEENKFITEDGFGIGYYIEKGKAHWFFDFDTDSRFSGYSDLKKPFDFANGLKDLQYEIEKMKSDK